MGDWDGTDSSFGRRHFGEANLGDIRRTKRLIRLADAFVQRPDATLPRKCGAPSSYQALLDLLQRPEVTHATVTEAHRARTHHAVAQRAQQVTLLVGDITELDFTTRTAVGKEVGPIGNGRGFGYECFNLLAVDPVKRSVIGLANQLLFCRRRRKVSRARARKLPVGTRQSGLWVRATQSLPPAPPGARWVRVFDREGDTDEVLRAPHDYLIRSRANRRIVVGSGPDAREDKLHAHLRALPPAGTREVVVQEAAGRAARTATCGVSFDVVHVRWSKPNGSSDGAPTRAYGVRVWELDPPAGEQGVEWLLLTSVAVTSASDAQSRVGWYECRWLSEEYHKALKTGVRIEGPQLTARERLEPLLGLLSVVALELLWVRDAARDESHADRPAEELVEPVLVELAGASSMGVKVLGPRMTAGEFYRVVARLGGYLGNFQKKPPGWQTLWHGWVRLNMMAQGLYRQRLPM